MSLDIESLPFVTKHFHVPELEQLCRVLNKGLKKHFAQVKVEVVACPDLTQAPFVLANQGLNGNPRLVEVGGPAYLLPLVQRDKIYDCKAIAELIGINPAFMIGAGAGPFRHAKTNCEGIMNLNIDNGTVVQQTRISKVNSDGTSLQETLDNSITEFGLLANLFVSEGKPGNVLKVHATKRIGGLDFVASIRTVLEEHFGPEEIVGLGGTFLMKTGKGKFHVMPDFSSTPLTTDEQLNNWLKFYNMSAPMVAVGTLTTGEYDLDLRVQHFHAFSDHNEAGHYHIDTTPDVVEYEGYFNVGEIIYRIDRPPLAQALGKD